MDSEFENKPQGQSSENERTREGYNPAGGYQKSYRPVGRTQRPRINHIAHTAATEVAVTAKAVSVLKVSVLSCRVQAAASVHSAAAIRAVVVMVTATVVATSHVSREAISLVLSRVAIVLVTTIMMSRVVISLVSRVAISHASRAATSLVLSRVVMVITTVVVMVVHRVAAMATTVVAAMVVLSRVGYGNNRGGYGRPQGGGYGNNRGGGFRQHTPGYDPNAKYSMKKRIEYKEENIDPTEPLRLNKFLANAGVCSRREADEFIQAGLVTVNGEVVTELGTKILRTDEVKFHDAPVTLEKKVYVLLNKPKDYVTTSDDPQQRKTVMDLVKDVCPERIYPVGRLDRNTTGVLLLTNDGDLASKLTHPKFLKKKVYHVHLDKNLTAHDMDQIREGITLEDGEIKADAVEYADDRDKAQVGIEIHSGKNRIVRRIFESSAIVLPSSTVYSSQV